MVICLYIFDFIYLLYDISNVTLYTYYYIYREHTTKKIFHLGL